MKQTAVEWLSQQILDNWNDIQAGARDIMEFVNQAKEMEKEQMFGYIKKNYVNGENSLKFHTEEFENYYNETFKSK